MKIYKCLISGDEVFTDAYRYESFMCFYKIQGKLTTRSNKIDESALGANPSQEEQEEQAEDQAESGINLVMDNRLVETGFGTKKEYTAYFKDFIKSIEAKLTEKDSNFDSATFRAANTEGFKWVLAGFKDFQFFTGASQDPEGLIILCNWEKVEGEADQVPVFYYFKDAVKEEKV